MEESIRNNSMNAVRSFVETLGGSPDSFSTKLNVLATGTNKYLFRNLYISIYYNIPYMQYTINILWEDDTGNPDYKSLKLHGCYNTNFQQISFTNSNLTFYDGDNQISIYAH